MDESACQKAVPSQERKRTLLPPSAVQFAAHKLRVKARQKFAKSKKSRPPGAKPNENRHEKVHWEEQEADDGKPNAGSVNEDVDEQEETNYEGSWMLLFDSMKTDSKGLTKHDRAWLTIDDLCDRGLLPYAEASTSLCKSYPCTDTLGCIWCYTEDYRDEEDVRIRADVIRKALELELADTAIFYKRDGEKLYSHTSDYSFWRDSGRGDWELVRDTKEGPEKSTTTEFRKAVPSRVKTPSWIGPSVVEREKYNLRYKAKRTPVKPNMEAPSDRISAANKGGCGENNGKGRPNHSKPTENIGTKPKDEKVEEKKAGKEKGRKTKGKDHGKEEKEPDQKEEAVDEEDPEGMWLLFFNKNQKDANSLTELDRSWRKIDDLCDKGFLHNADVSTAGFNEVPCTEDLGCIRCYTEDHKEEQEIQWKGDVIRRALHRELKETLIYYVKATPKKVKISRLANVSIYRHTPDYLFWKKNEETGRWDFVVRNPGEKRTRIKFGKREVVPSRINYDACLTSAAPGVNVTAQVTKNTAKSKSENAKQKDAKSYRGKWLIQLDHIERDLNDHTQHDRAWFKIEDLCLKNSLCLATASTAMESELRHTPDKGCISCFTSDYRDEEEVRRTAQLIRRTLKDELQGTNIYYKTDAATRAKLYSKHMHERVTMYRQKPDGGLWKRKPDEETWNLIFKPDKSYYRSKAKKQ